MWETWYTVSLILGIPAFVTTVVAGVVGILKCCCPERYKVLKERIKCCDTKKDKSPHENEEAEGNEGNGQDDTDPLIDSSSDRQQSLNSDYQIDGKSVSDDKIKRARIVSESGETRIKEDFSPAAGKKVLLQEN